MRRLLVASGMAVAFLAGSPARADDHDARKVDGAYLTAVPLFSYDPDFGYGTGLRVSYFDDGHRQDPLFARTPYLERVYAQALVTLGGFQDYVLDYDAPAFPDPDYRLRARLGFESIADWPYFGTGTSSLAPLSFPGAPGRTFSRLSDYQRATSALQPGGLTFASYNLYELQRPEVKLALERKLLGGKLRSMVGVRIAYARLEDYSGQAIATSARDSSGNPVSAAEAPTLLFTDCAAGRVVGCAGGWDNVLRLALSIDTRDFEPSPGRGVYAELSGEYGTPALASQYPYMRLMLSVRGFYRPIPRYAELVLAARGVYEVQTSGTPFFSESVLPFVDESQSGLGGFRTLRGFAQNRFVGPVIALTNYEARWTFARFRALGQGFAVTAVPFLDLGRVFDDVGQTTLGGWKRAQGGGLRIAWNEATLVMADYGFSEEGQGLYVSFGHMF